MSKGSHIITHNLIKANATICLSTSSHMFILSKIADDTNIEDNHDKTLQNLKKVIKYCEEKIVFF